MLRLTMTFEKLKVDKSVTYKPEIGKNLMIRRAILSQRATFPFQKNREVKIIQIRIR